MEHSNVISTHQLLSVIGSDGKVCGIITSTDLLRSYQKIHAALENNLCDPRV
jgi:hypothetical protein